MLFAWVSEAFSWSCKYHSTHIEAVEGVRVLSQQFTTKMNLKEVMLVSAGSLSRR